MSLLLFAASLVTLTYASLTEHGPLATVAAAGVLLSLAAVHEEGEP